MNLCNQDARVCGEFVLAEHLLFFKTRTLNVGYVEFDKFEPLCDFIGPIVEHFI